MNNRKKIFASGCFDMLHSGHVAFLKKVSIYGDVYVGIGSDSTIKQLKGKYPIYSQNERKFLIESLKYVKHCVVNSGSGLLDFVDEIKRILPDIFIVNEDGHSQLKAQLCNDLGIQYKILRRKPLAGLPVRSTTRLRNSCQIPYRLDLAGGWLDQPSVSKYASGPVITVCVEPTVEFRECSGMATSTRKSAKEIWNFNVPAGNKERLAKILFSYENPPGTKIFSGSQDAIGITFPGLNRLDFDGNYWPKKIQSINEEPILDWIERYICLIEMRPRPFGFYPYKNSRPTPQKINALACASNRCWNAIQNLDLGEFGRQMKASFDAQVKIFPSMVDRDIEATIRRYTDKSLGWKLSGAGGGGYLVLVTERHISNAIRIKIRRR